MKDDFVENTHSDFRTQLNHKKIYLDLRESPNKILDEGLEYRLEHYRNDTISMIDSLVMHGYLVEHSRAAMDADGSLRRFELNHHMWSLYSNIPEEFFRVVAMQIVCPERYSEFFNGKLCFDAESPRMKHLLDNVTECLYGARSSKYLGKNDGENLNRAQRKIEREAKRKAKRESAEEYKQWVSDCQERKSKLKSMWNEYAEATAEKTRRKKWYALERKRMLAEFDQKAHGELSELADKCRIMREDYMTLKNSQID